VTQVLFEAALKSTVMLLLVFGVAMLLRRASAAARHTVWSSGFAGLLALPFLATTLPWRLEVLPAAASFVGSVGRSDGRTVAAVPSDGPTVQPSVEVSEPAVDKGPTVESVTNFPAPISQAASAESRSFDAGYWLVVLWFVGAGLVVGRVLLGWVLMMWLARRGQPLDDASWTDLLDAAERRMGIATHVRLLRGTVPMPMTSGLLRPVIVLPQTCDEWSTDRRYAVLLHELAHVRRGDLWVHFLVQAACACYWFHPLAWSAARRLRSDSERACDDLVLSAGTRASEYAGHLLQLVRHAGPGRAPAVALPMAQRSDFEGRLLAILEPELPRRPLAPLTAIATAITVAFLAVPLAAMSPTRPEVIPSESPAATEVVAAESQAPSPTPTPTPRVSVKSPKGGAPKGGGPVVSVSVDADAIAAIAQEAVSGITAAIAQHAPRMAQHVSSAAVKGLVTALADVDIEVRRHAAQALGGMESSDTAAINALSQALTRDADPGVRKTAAWALGEIEDSRAVTALVTALRNDKDVEVRKTAAWALGQIESPLAIDGLGAALKDSSPEVRKTAVWALGEIEDARAVPVLVPFLKDTDVEIRKTAVWALGQIESAEAVTALATLTRDPNQEVRKQVAWALGEIESSTAIDPLTVMVKDADVEVRATAVWALGQIEDPRAAPAVASVLTDANAEVRQKAAWAMGEIGARTAPPALIAALKDSDREVRKTAAWALGEIGDPAAVPGLSLLLKDSDNEIRRTALWALGEIGDETAYDAIVAALKDGDPEVRRAAAQALGKRH
jgi:HEAT repeat protein/beta-lactamase regulating signal transducer with metallopeptidase domain